MSWKSWKSTLAALVASVAAVACSDGSSILQTEGPSALRPSFSGESGSELRLMQRTVPLLDEMSTARQVGPNGGTLRIKQAGIVVKVPAGALDESVHLRLVALPGDDVAFEFEPHGISFNQPLELRIFVEDTELEYLEDQNTPNGPLDDVTGVYWEGDLATGFTILETFPVEYYDGRLIFETDHFSGYALAM